MSRRLNVVHVTGCLDIGGQEKLLVEFARHADRARFALRFVSLGSLGVLADELEALGWPVTALDIAPGLHLGLPVKLARLFREWRTDIVHTHNDRPLIYAATAGRLARVACVIHTKHGRSTGNSRRQNTLAAWTARLTDHFVCVSDDAAQLAQAQGVPAKRIATLHNGIDTERYAGVGPRRDGPAVVVARLCPDKDLATLLQAVALVKPQAPEFRLWIAGDGPSLPELRDLSSRLGLDESVRFLGMVRDVPALLGQASQFVLSSISEGVPLTLLEAMASGLPTVATRVGGIAEVARDGETSLLVPPRDPLALAAALLRVHQNDDLARDLGAAGRRHVESHFEIRRMIDRYQHIYLSAAGRSPTVPRREQPEVHGCASHI